MKTCTKCNIEQSLDNFTKDPRGKGGRRASCRTCHAAWMKEYNAKNAEQNRAKQKIRDAMRPKGARHGLTENEYQTLKDKFDGLCWSCQGRPGVAIDHDHACCPGVFSCGKCVRGLLCSQCNMALGLLGDSRQTIESLLRYVK